MNWSLLKVLIPVFWPWQMKQPRPKGSLKRQKNSRIFGNLAVSNLNLCISSLSFEEDAQPQDRVQRVVQRVAHILSSVPAKRWFWHFIVSWIPVVLEYNVFVCRCKLYLEWRFLIDCILHELVVAGWDTGGEASASLGQSTGWSERPWFSGQGRCSALKPEKQPEIKCRNCSPGKTCWTLPSNLQHAVLLRQLGAQRPVQGQKSSKHNENSNQRGNTDRLRDEVYQFEKLNMKWCSFTNFAPWRVPFLRTRHKVCPVWTLCHACQAVSSSSLGRSRAFRSKLLFKCRGCHGRNQNGKLPVSWD